MFIHTFNVLRIFFNRIQWCDQLTEYLHLALEFWVGFLFEEAILLLGVFIPQAQY